MLICASTGIAAIDYEGGTTAHALFRIPVVEPNSPLGQDERIVCRVGGTTQRADLIRKAHLIMWDEVAMINRQAFYSVDLLLRDLM